MTDDEQVWSAILAAAMDCAERTYPHNPVAGAIGIIVNTYSEMVGDLIEVGDLTLEEALMHSEKDCDIIQARLREIAEKL
jgi:hypothetical protein